MSLPRAGPAGGAVANFDGHFVISESFWPMKPPPELLHGDDHLAPVPERVGHSPV